MANSRNRAGSSRRRDNWSAGVMDIARERPVAAAAVAAGAAAAGLFLWSKRSQISSQLSNLSDQIGEWTENMGGYNSSTIDDTAGLTSTGRSGSGTGTRTRSATGTRSTTAKRSATGSRARAGTNGTNRPLSEGGGENVSLGADSGGIGTATNANS